ncbi:MFS transporter [Alginatibacterium sediminis]|uniref:MFS transporter n=1 Tax=Alginatibacterium sediminis TaxID=2164068 RepID=A0A420E8V2_9ALTE|nr:sugar efflux transporter [Alginatibacterium sediminis]RKF15811.1 MFS transporter [Alginatibacterium sediminis]
MRSYAHYFTGQTGLLLLNCLFNGLSFSFIYPVMSFFLVQELQSPPILIGVYTICVTLSGLIISQVLGYLTDKGLSAKTSYCLSLLSISIASGIFSIADNYWQVWLAGIVFMGIGAASMPLLLTIIREAAIQQNRDVRDMNAVMRATISLAWIAGPPLAYGLIAQFGFTASFGSASIITALTVVLAIYSLPNTGIKAKDSQQEPNTPISFHIWLLCLVLLFVNMANGMYGTAMPLYSLNERDLPAYLPGLLFGVAAGLEVPIMIIASRLANHFGTQKLMGIATICGAVFYTGIYSASQGWHFIALQLCNAIFFGVFASLGVTVIQEMLPNRPGFASALFSNSMRAGMMIGTSLTGIIAQFYSFQTAILGASIAVICAAVCLGWAARVSSSEQKA